MMEIEKLTELVIEALEDVKAQDIHVMDVRDITTIADYMIIASGNSNRQVKALAQNVTEQCKKKGIVPLGTEGEEKAEWVLVDLADIIVHIMQPAIRDFYQLEKLWAPQDDESSEDQAQGTSE